MANYVDHAIANITDALKKHGYWNNTLVVFSADNGTFSLLAPITSNHTLSRF
jgi:arylsulfatase A-like enzyme